MGEMNACSNSDRDRDGVRDGVRAMARARTMAGARAVSPAIATIALIAVAAAAATIAGSDMIRKATLSSPAKPVEVNEIFMVKVNDSRVLLHIDYIVRPGWTTLTATFRDDINNTVTFSLPTDATMRKYDTNLVTQVAIGNRYNLIITATGDGNNSAATTVPVFVR